MRDQLSNDDRVLTDSEPGRVAPDEILVFYWITDAGADGLARAALLEHTERTIGLHRTMIALRALMSRNLIWRRLTVTGPMYVLAKPDAGKGGGG